MSDLSNYLENELLDHLRNSAYTPPTNLYLALYTSNPDEDDSGTELTLNSNGYTRQEVTFGAATGGTMTNSNAPSFTASGGNWGTITYAGVKDGTGAAANLLWYSALASSRTVNDTDTLTFSAGQITMTLA